MDKVRYMISDAAAVVQVESHVLRYWEEELELQIPRNELGHRYYTQENIREFQRIKELKERGYQLKAIKMILLDEKERAQQEHPQKADDRELLVPEPARPAITIEKVNGVDIDKEVIKEAVERTELQFANQTAPYIDEAKQRERRMEQFQAMMTEIVKKAISENNQELGEEVGLHVGEHVLKEMNYLMRTQEEQEEERYRKLDEAIRNIGKRGRFGKKERLSRKERKELKNKNKLAPDLSI